MKNIYIIQSVKKNMVTKREKRGNYFGKGKMDKKNVQNRISQKVLDFSTFSTFSTFEKSGAKHEANCAAKMLLYFLLILLYSCYHYGNKIIYFLLHFSQKWKKNYVAYNNPAFPPTKMTIFTLSSITYKSKL